MAQANFRHSFARGDWETALGSTRAAMRLAPRAAGVWTDAAVCLLRLERWDEAIAHAARAVRLGDTGFAALDAAAHACGSKRDWAGAREWGLRALTARDRAFAGEAATGSALPPVPLPSAPSPATRARNFIAFSLFGADAKYCESAILNVGAAREVYPDWTCRFYIGGDVPGEVVGRLAGEGAEIVAVDARLAHWPGPMWRFAACDERGLHRVLLRDADSVVSAREAGAVAEWIASGRPFHLMRDSGSHTELVLAGLWGMVGGALTSPSSPQALPMRGMIERFLAEGTPDRRFADQHFLRRFLWPQVRGRALTHDSIFGFMDPLPFPDGPPPADFHVGYAEGSPRFTQDCGYPDGTVLDWRLHEGPRGEGKALTCRYRAQAGGGKISAHLPARLARRLEAGEAALILTPAKE
jgi:hypothetical protein